MRRTPRATLFLILTIAIGTLHWSDMTVNHLTVHFRYLECHSDATSEVKLCEEGKSFNLVLGVCQDEKSVDCLTRNKKWKIVPSKTKKIRLFGKLQKPSISRPAVVTTISSTIPPSSSPVAVMVSSTRAPAVEEVVHHDPLLEAECEADGGVYVVPDPLHCDRYLLCPDKTVELCEAGDVLDTRTGYCALRAKVQCGDRTLNMRNIQVCLSTWQFSHLVRHFTAGTVGGQAEGEGEGNCTGNRGDQPVPLHLHHNLHHHQTSRGDDPQIFPQELWNSSPWSDFNLRP